MLRFGMNGMSMGCVGIREGRVLCHPSQFPVQTPQHVFPAIPWGQHTALPNSCTSPSHAFHARLAKGMPWRAS